jgi:hypothetical protein
MSQTNQKNNPASRLLVILNAARRVNGASSCRRAWGEVFGISEIDTEDGLIIVISRLVALRKLFNETESVLRSIPNLNEELFISPIPRLAKVVSWNSLTDTFSTYQNHLNVADMTALKFAENQLSLYEEFTENSIPADELQSIINDINGLYESIINSGLPAELKESLLDLLQEIRRGIHEYRIRGYVALREALTKSVGVIAANRESIEENSNEPEIISLRSVLEKLDGMATFATNKKRKPLLEAAAGIIPLLAGK